MVGTTGELDGGRARRITPLRWYRVTDEPCAEKELTLMDHSLPLPSSARIEEQKNDDHGAALLPADPSASPASTEALPNRDRLRGLILFIGAKADAAEQAAQSRRYYATASDGMSAADIEAARRLAEQMAGHAIPRESAREQKQARARDLRIADKCDAEARMFREVYASLELLVGSATVPPQEHADPTRRSAAPNTNSHTDLSLPPAPQQERTT